MKNRTKRWINVAVFLVLLGLLVWWVWPKDKTTPPGPTGPDANAPGQLAGHDANAAGARDANAPQSATRPTTREAPANEAVLALRKLSQAEALQAAARGRQLVADGKLAEGRAELSRALLSEKLPADQQAALRTTLGELADKMLFSSRIFDGDPYATQYTFQSREVLARVEVKLRLHVPTQTLLAVNRIGDPRTIRAGQTLKMILGPFHAIVAKGGFTMDLYLSRPPNPPVYVRRLRVGLGKDGSTPIGLWRVALGKKRDRAPWYPPPNSPVRRSIQWGQPDYPLGKRGYWIGLEGLDANTRMHTGYGIHGTNDPASIGRAESLGCIRLADADIEQVFSLLYEKWSTVEVRP